MWWMSIELLCSRRFPKSINSFFAIGSAHLISGGAPASGGQRRCGSCRWRGRGGWGSKVQQNASFSGRSAESGLNNIWDRLTLLVFNNRSNFSWIWFLFFPVKQIRRYLHAKELLDIQFEWNYVLCRWWQEAAAFFAIFFLFVVEESSAFFVSTEMETTTTAAGSGADGKSSRRGCACRYQGGSRGDGRRWKSQGNCFDETFINLLDVERRLWISSFVRIILVVVFRI